MTARVHRYIVTTEWTGAGETGSSAYDAYGRDHLLSVSGAGPEGPAPIRGSSDPAFRGEASRWNPEQLLVASLSACHQLWWLHLCAVNAVTVLSYVDQAEGEMIEEGAKGGRFTRIVLRPHARLAPGSDSETARRLHAEAHALCFIANSLSVPVEIAPSFA